MFPVSLLGPRITLREWQEDDAPAVYSYASQPIVTKFLPWETHADLDDTREYLESVMAAAREDPRSTYDFAVVFRADGEERLLGGGRISIRDTTHRRGDIGYVVHPDWWSRGIGTELATLLVDFGFTTLGLHRIEATAEPLNVASQKILTKVGMTYEGRIRDHMYVGGTWRDSFSYAILETDARRRPTDDGSGR